MRTLRHSLALAAWCLLATAAGLSSAEMRPLEAVGAVPITPGREAEAAQEAALDEAITEAVLRVTRELLLDVELPGEPDQDPEEALVEILGGDMRSYASRFRITEDIGERPALFAEDPEVTAEYVLVVEVHVDVDQIKNRLVEAGLLIGGETHRVGRELRIGIKGLNDYRAYQAFRSLLLDEVGARSVLPLEFERGRVVLGVDSDHGAAAFRDQMLGRSPGQFEIDVVRTSRNALELNVVWNAPGEPSESSGDAGRRDQTRGRRGLGSPGD